MCVPSANHHKVLFYLLLSLRGKATTTTIAVSLGGHKKNLRSLFPTHGCTLARSPQLKIDFV